MRFPPFGILVLILYSIIHQTRANTPQIFVTNSLVKFDAQIVERSANGGEDRWDISYDTNHPFAGRQFGGAERSDLNGTQIFGSGYPYGNKNKTTIAGRPFPFGLWPIYWDNNTMGSDEYGPALDGIRPGGQLVTIPLIPQMGAYNLTGEEIYYILGDRDSALFMMISLVTSCNVKPAWPSKFAPHSANSTIGIVNITKYYRASSFALAFRGYNNQFAAGNQDTESTTNTPLPDIVVDSKFRQCLDNVIFTELAIMGTLPMGDLPFSDKVCIIVFSAIPTWVCTCYYICRERKRSEAKKRIAEQIRQGSAARQAALAYESYP
jgi:hypothetical protein